MRPIRILLGTICLIFLTLGCGNSKKTGNSKFSLKTSHSSKQLKAKDSLRLFIKHPQKESVDSVIYFYADQRIAQVMGNNDADVALETPLGKNELSALVYSKGKEYKTTKEITLYAEKKAKVYTYKIINSYPHDPLAFTQGLEFYNDTLYEGTGQYGVSALRKVDYKTGEVLQETALGKKYFGEGITILNDKIYFLTWREKVGFIYDAQSLKQIGSFDYGESKEGWGLCNDGHVFYKSDGSSRIWLLDPETLKEKEYIQPVTQNSLANRVNEMEFIEGKIYANTWQKDGVLIIDPKTGAVEGIIDFRGLKDHLGNRDKADVLNGIAYLKSEKRLFVTGKKWDKLFEVEIIPR